MSSLALEMRSAVLSLAGPRRDSDTRESMISRAARRAGISYRTAKSLFYGEASDPRASVVERVRAALADHQFNSEAVARAELADLEERISVLGRQLEAMGTNKRGGRSGASRPSGFPGGGGDDTGGAAGRAMADGG